VQWHQGTVGFRVEEGDVADEAQQKVGLFRRRRGTMTDETQQQARRDPLVEHVVPLIAKAMSTTQDTEELWSYIQERVEVECRRMEDDAVREALEPLRERYSIETVARVAAAMAQQAVVGEAQVA
jgi:tryptophanyl-tRNA synthetase